MMTTLLAGGTVRAQFDDGDGRLRERKYLARALEELQVPGHYLAMVERMLELCPGVRSDESRAARIVVTALLSGINRGSTGLPLVAGDESDGIGLKPEVELLLSTARRLDEEGLVFDGLSAEDVIMRFRAIRAGENWKALFGEGMVYRPVIVEDEVLYTHKMAAMERRVARAIARLLSGPEVIDIADAEEYQQAVLENMPFEMAPDERAEKVGALATALPGRFAVISGGAGSGKTTIVLTLLRVLRRLSPQQGGIKLSEMALAAPTGKAAKRLGESMADQLAKIDGDEVELFRNALGESGNLEPKTLHRLLEYSPYFNKFKRHRDNRLDAKLVVVDEASMVGLGMMQALVEALPDDGRLLLVGDAGQLPSVQAGAVFHDLSTREGAPPRLRERICVLEGNYRVHDDEDAQNIVAVAREVRDGETSIDELSGAGLLTRAASISDRAGVYFVEYDADERNMGHFLRAWWARHYASVLAPANGDDDRGRKPEPPVCRRRNIFDHDEDGRFEEGARQKLEKLFEAIASAQILCVTRVGRRGSQSINAQMHRRYIDANELSGNDADRFEPGEPVIITRNDYEEGVFNGDQGIVLYTRNPDERQTGKRSENAKKRIVIRDGDDFRVVSFDRLRDKLKHAYALTVHKSQGSEYDHVAMILPELIDLPNGGDQIAIHPLMTRQILYTGLTRAKTSVTVFGEETVFDEGVKCSAGRYSGVRRRLNQMEGRVAETQVLADVE